MSRIPANLQDKWVAISTKRYADQCKWLLNGFWEKLEPEAENLWGWCHTFIKLDEAKHAEGCDLDEFWSHKFLETLGQTMTVLAMRESFRAIDADFNKRMSILEYVMWRFNLKPVDVVNAPQGTNQAEMKKAQGMVDAAQAAVDEVTAKLEISRRAAEQAAQTLQASTKAAAEAKAAAAKAASTAADARKTATEATKAAEASWFAEQENRKALEELQAQEKAFQEKKAALEAAKNDQTAGVVKRNKAANELDQLLAEDPLPLRKAKINQAATLKKCEKARAAADAAKAKADEDAASANAAEQASREAAAAAEEAARVAADDAQAAADAAAAVETAVAEANAKLQEALDYLESVKAMGGVSHGDVWWMSREVEEKKKYLPKRK